MKTNYSVLFLSMLMASAASAQTDAWFYKAFGQSTDSNFSSNVLPAKVGVNQVSRSEGEAPLRADVAYPLPASFILESRGGKLANSHDGMTVFYQAIPVDRAFVLQAEVSVSQFGPENGKTPNGQEGVGLFVRDSLGPQRKVPQPLGHEEFPHAANMVLNAVQTHNKSDDNRVDLVSVARQGVVNPWGNEGVKVERIPYQKGVSLDDGHFLLRLERKQGVFELTWSTPDGQRQAVQRVVDKPGLLDSQDPRHAYLGFFAARNAKVRFDNASLTLGGPIAMVDEPSAPAAAQSPLLEIASATTSSQLSYLLQVRSNLAGTLQVAGQTVTLQAGNFSQLPLVLAEGENLLQLTFTPTSQPDAPAAEQKVQQIVITREPARVADVRHIYVSPTGQADNAGTRTAPVDLATALEQLVPGGTIVLADGHYPGMTLAAEQSGLPGEPKRLVAEHRHRAVFTGQTSQLNASFWHLDGLVFDGNPDGTKAEHDPAFLRVAGSHNRLERLIARNNADTGVWITGNGVYGQASLWPAYNQVINSDSYNNRDESGINADGFATKLGVGPGNLFKGCVAHNNADDGWDLFNKIEDGPNQAVTIINSVAYGNGLPFGHPAPAGTIGNGFKLGGEGQPVAHQIYGSLSVRNNMDGFTDNFNTGALLLKGNIALDNARYNYIMRDNPYGIGQHKVTFMDNVSLHYRQQGKYADYLGNQVVKPWHAPEPMDKHQQILLARSLEDMATLERDGAGNLIMPWAVSPSLK
ncbi:TPA: hypothetical protein SIA28_003963 [Aeromonas salmonicida]|nr:hypothetical protein [Aeromonas salmonicida]HEH9424103.1 hypothetical protein [Aeromonas salmonicida]HEH9437349.1 hypothetical protein [Aeromonas salmonicida]